MRTNEYRELLRTQREKKEAEENVKGCASVFAVLLFVALVALWTDRNLEFWMTYYKGATVTVPYWLSFLLTAGVRVLLGPVFLLANIVAEIGRLFVG